MKFCKDCKHFSEGALDAFCMKAPMTGPDPVYGRYRYYECATARSSTFTTANQWLKVTHCGPEAKNYEDL